MELASLLVGASLTLCSQIVTDRLRNGRDSKEWKARTLRQEQVTAVGEILRRQASIQDELQACKFSDPIPESIHAHTRQIQVEAAFVRTARERDFLETLADVIWWSDDIARLEGVSEQLAVLRRAHRIAWQAGNAVWEVAGAILREEPCEEPADFSLWSRQLQQAAAIRERRQAANQATE